MNNEFWVLIGTAVAILLVFVVLYFVMWFQDRIARRNNTDAPTPVVRYVEKPVTTWTSSRTVPVDHEDEAYCAREGDTFIVSDSMGNILASGRVGEGKNEWPPSSN